MRNAPIAQPDRVFGYEPKGRGFESLLARQRDAGPNSFWVQRYFLLCFFGASGTFCNIFLSQKPLLSAKTGEVFHALKGKMLSGENCLKNTEKHAKSGDGEVMKSVLTSVFSFGRGNGKMNSVFLRLSAEQKLRKSGNRQKKYGRK